MVLFGIHTICPIFMIIPFMIVVVLPVMVGDGLAIFGLQHCRCYCDGANEGGRQESRMQKTGRG